ncbi:MAG: ABC transporter ATP-binding protein [Microthrixaceae bacterium]
MRPDNTIVVDDVMVEHRNSAEVVRALEPMSLTVEGGTSVAVMGPSGCGKSTLLGLLAGLALPTAGTVAIGDETISRLDERRRVLFRRQRLGMVYQADNLLPHLTVEENVGLQLAICHGETAPDAPEEVAKVLDRLGIGELATRLPDQLSGGQRQRAAVARAIIHRPSVVLADEPTGALDHRSATAAIELLVEVQREMRATLVMVTHDPVVAAHLDRTIEMRRPVRVRESADAR